MLPAAIFGGVLGYFLGRLCYGFMISFIGIKIRQGSAFDYVVEFIATAASALLSLYFACQTAPSHGRLVYWATAGLIVIYNVPSVMLLFKQFHGVVLVGLVGTAVGAAAASSVLDDLSEGQMAAVDYTTIEFEDVQRFLAEEPAEQILALTCMGPVALGHCIKSKHSVTTARKDIAPDTQDANEAATADADLWDSVEEKVAELRSREAPLWEKLKQTISQITPNVSASDLTRFERR